MRVLVLVLVGMALPACDQIEDYDLVEVDEMDLERGGLILAPQDKGECSINLATQVQTGCDAGVICNVQWCIGDLCFGECGLDQPT